MKTCKQKCKYFNTITIEFVTINVSRHKYYKTKSQPLNKKKTSLKLIKTIFFWLKKINIY